MKIAVCQLNSTAGSINENLQKIKDCVSNPKFADADIFAFPEFFITGYPLKSLLDHSWFIKNAENAAKDLLEFSKKFPKAAIVFGNVTKNARKTVSVSTFAINNGEIISSQDSYTENSFFVWKDQKIGILLGDLGGENESCRNSAKILRVKGAKILINICSSPFYADKYKVREKEVLQIAQKNKISVVALNSVGANDGLIFDGGSFLANQNGIVQQLKFFEEEIKIIDTNIEKAEKIVAQAGEIEQIYCALKLGIKDYFEKCGFKQTVIGLSGGIDSALVASLAVDTLGKENVLGITMPSQFSSSGSVEDSLKLARNLGIVCETIPIKNSFATLLETLSPIFKETEFNIAEENMQSRIRGILLMAVSNKFNRLLLATGNKSEAAVGYCTLYGDTNGALAVVADVYKTDIYRLADYINRNVEIIPADIITKSPSAELRSDQKDEDSLPPYQVLDNILKLLLEEGKSCEEIILSGEKREIVEWASRAIKNSEYKRAQSTMVLKVSKAAFGTDISFPVSANYTR